MNIKELAALLKGTFGGGDDIEITGLDGIETAKAGDLTFAVDAEKLGLAEKSDASCVLTGKNIRKSTKPLIRVNDPKLSFIIVYNLFAKAEKRQAFRHPTSVVSEKAKLGKDIWIGPYVVIEDNVTIGDGTIIESYVAIKKGCKVGSCCHLYPNVTLYDNSHLGNNIILHSGVVIGSDGFGYVRDAVKVYKFPQLGKVIIEDNVEIGSNTTIDRGSLNNHRDRRRL